MSDFARFWNEVYPNAQPVGYLMRAADARHWVRFHSLPFSKRYPETADERAMLLARQNELAGEVLGHDQDCWLIQTCWVTPEGYTETADEQVSFQETSRYGLQRAFTFREGEDDEDACVWDVMVAHVRWAGSTFDQVLMRIAEEQAAPTMWVSSKTGGAFAPYDGGVDLFLPSATIAGTFRSKYEGWLSPLTTGL